MLLGCFGCRVVYFVDDLVFKLLFLLTCCCYCYCSFCFQVASVLVLVDFVGWLLLLD